ncbi:amidohydrolase [Acidobacteriota bacterium]
MKVFYICFALLFLLTYISCQPPSEKNDVDLILLNGMIWTVNPDQPWAEAVAISGGKILAIGSTNVVNKLKGSATKSIDLHGAFVIPGFIDSHTHFLQGGFSLSSIQLYEVKSQEEFVAKIRERVESIGKGEWILSGNWDHQKFDPPELPHKNWIDSVTPENPVCIYRHDGHMVLVNSLAMKLAGISVETLSPSGGEIIKDPLTGELTGILKDAAIGLVSKHIPESTLDEKVKAAAAALDHAAQIGVTSIHDMNFEESVQALVELFRDNKLTAHIHGYIPISQSENLSKVISKIPPNQFYLTIGGLKGFVDGSLGSETAYFFEPYTDNPLTSGLLAPDMFPDGEMEKRILQADKEGLQLAVHAIGDRANNLILDIFERVINQNGARDRRWRIEHAQHLLPEDMIRFSELGILASMQPYHAIDDGRWAEKKIGPARAQTTYAFQSLLDKKAVLVFGSDWTVAPMNPLMGIYAAVTRNTLDGYHPEGWFQEQKISLEEAIKGYTLNGAFAEFEEVKKGSLEEGKYADIVVLDKNLFDIPASEIPQTQVLLTIVGGEIVYKR